MSLALLSENIAIAQNSECGVDYSLVYAVAMNERHPDRDVGYPFLISFNKSNAYAKKKYKALFLDKRTIDCKDKKTCVSIVSDLSKKGVTNLDLGAFQINEHYHPSSDLGTFFTLGVSMNIACRIISTHIKKHGYNWSAIARYHSATPKHNNIYASNLKKNYLSIKGR